MRTLIIKTGATGDVVRTTPLLTVLAGEVTWLTAAKNVPLLRDLGKQLRCFAWEERERALDIAYDLIINLEDTWEAAQFVQTIRAAEVFGARMGANNSLRYTDNSKPWFDLSLISAYGKERADRLKFANRRTYQDLIFESLGLQFTGQPYRLPDPIGTSLSGDVAIGSEAGPVWPMKKWAFYDELQKRLEREGLIVNRLPQRTSLIEHLSDVRNHKCLLSGDSLPMHFALGTGTPCVALFTCTSPWEIFDYGILTKIVSPLLGEFFYRRGYDERATRAISVDEVFNAVIARLELATTTQTLGS